MTSRTRTTGFVLALALAAALFVGSFVGATQYAASRLSSRWRLGPPAFVVEQTPVYVPWAWLKWSERLKPTAPQVFALAQAINFGGALAAFAVLMAAVAGIRGNAVSTTHGSARWAVTKDLRRAGLLDPGGVVLCQTADARYASRPDGKSGTRWAMKRAGRLVRHDGPEHVFVFAPTRSGKGIGIVIPTLLTWSRSVLVYDIKKELWAATAGWRRRFSHCWRFELVAGRSPSRVEGQDHDADIEGPTQPTVGDSEIVI